MLVNDAAQGPNVAFVAIHLMGAWWETLMGEFGLMSNGAFWAPPDC